MKKNNYYVRTNNKKGFTLFLVVSIILLVIFWRMASESSELISYMNLQKTEIKKSGIELSQGDAIYFELD